MRSSPAIILCAVYLLRAGFATAVASSKWNSAKVAAAGPNATIQNSVSTVVDVSCNCGVFLTGQFVKGSPKPPTGNPAITTEPEETFPCNEAGLKKCTTKCLENLVQYLSTSAGIICGSVERDVFRERAHLFVKNCDSNWINTRMSSGREYCCKNYEFHQCPKSAT